MRPGRRKGATDSRAHPVRRFAPLAVRPRLTAMLSISRVLQMRAATSSRSGVLERCDALACRVAGFKVIEREARAFDLGTAFIEHAREQLPARNLAAAMREHAIRFGAAARSTAFR